MKPLHAVTALLVVFLLCIAMSSAGLLGGSVTTSGAPVRATPTLSIFVVPGAEVPGTGATEPVEPAPGEGPKGAGAGSGGVPTVPGPVPAVPSELPTTGAWGLPFDRWPWARWMAGPAGPVQLQAATPIARLIIPALGVDADVLPVAPRTKLLPTGERRQAWEIPDFAAGFLEGSAPPGMPGNTVISAHNNLGAQIFRQLEETHIYDQITLQLPNGSIYVYTVRKVMVLPEDGQPEAVRQENARYIGPFADTRLTLVSCWPDWSNTERVVVIATP